MKKTKTVTFDEKSTSEIKKDKKFIFCKETAIARKEVINCNKKLTEQEGNKLVRSVVIDSNKKIKILARDANNNDPDLQKVLRQDLNEISSIPSTGITLL